MAGVEVVRYTPGKVMQVKLTAPTRVSGKHYEAGQLLEVPEQVGFELLAAQKAERYKAPAEPKK